MKCQLLEENRQLLRFAITTLCQFSAVLQRSAGREERWRWVEQWAVRTEPDCGFLTASARWGAEGSKTEPAITAPSVRERVSFSSPLVSWAKRGVQDEWLMCSVWMEGCLQLDCLSNLLRLGMLPSSEKEKINLNSQETKTLTLTLTWPHSVKVPSCEHAILKVPFCGGQWRPNCRGKFGEASQFTHSTLHTRFPNYHAHELLMAYSGPLVIKAISLLFP